MCFFCLSGLYIITQYPVSYWLRNVDNVADNGLCKYLLSVFVSFLHPACTFYWLILLICVKCERKRASSRRLVNQMGEKINTCEQSSLTHPQHNEKLTGSGAGQCRFIEFSQWNCSILSLTLLPMSVKYLHTVSDKVLKEATRRQTNKQVNKHTHRAMITASTVVLISISIACINNLNAAFSFLDHFRYYDMWSEIEWYNISGETIMGDCV